MKIISFSLWGSDPKYNIGALRNAELAARLYPEWTCRFYCGSSVPRETIETLRPRKNVDLVIRPEPGDWRGLFWRFAAASDQGVHVMISRDTDSRLSRRERDAVEAWLETGLPFHVMRDHKDHGVPILGGLWGARRDAVPDLDNLIFSWEKTDRWGPDQDFLGEVVAPRVRHAWVEHDPYFANRPFPSRRCGREFVGQPFDEEDRPLIEGPTEFEFQTRRLVKRILRPFVQRARR